MCNSLRWFRQPATLLFGLLLGAASLAADDNYRWPEAPPAQLKEELFGIRFRLKLNQGGSAGAVKFLKAELARDPAPHTKAYVAWISLFSEGWKIPAIVDPLAARRLAEEAAGEGSLVAADVLGRAQIFGQGMDRDVEAGLTLLRRAAAAGLPRALARLGFYQLSGFGGLPVDEANGDALIRRAAGLGSMTGLVDTADAYETGRISSPIKEAKALQYYFLLALHNDGLGWAKLDEFAEKKVQDAAYYRVLAKVQFANDGGGVLESRTRKDVAELVAMKPRDTRGWVELGIAHLHGQYAKRDYPKALDYLRQAAAEGQSEAEFYLAYAKLRGFGVPRDPPAALAEMQQLADRGGLRAAAKLGWLYYWGASDVPGMVKDESKAFAYTRQAAAGGYWLALMNLGFCYEHGIGVKANPVLATKVFAEAMDRGAGGAKERVQRNLAFAKIP